MIIRTHKDLNVYQLAFKSSMEIFELTKSFPKEERYALIDQIRRSSRAVCANLAEAFRKRKYPKSFIAKICESEGEAAETQTWLDFSLECDYLDKVTHQKLLQQYENILGKLVKMARNPQHWIY